MPDDSATTEHDADPDGWTTEDAYVAVLDDQYAPGEGVTHDEEAGIWLTRCETDRPLYSFFADGEIVTTVDANEFSATHQVAEAFELARRGDIGGDLDDPEPTPTWH